MTLRACFVALADGLKDDLADPDGEFRMLYGYHAVRIRSAFDGYPDLPLHQDSVAGFLHGFLLTVGHCASGDTLQAAFPVLGGALLLGRALPIRPEDRLEGRAVLESLAVRVGDADPHARRDLLDLAFTAAGDVPVTCASLGGFCLGVTYAHPYLPCDCPTPPQMVAAACHVAGHLTP